MKARWSSVVVAKSDDVILFEGTRYFSEQDIDQAHVTMTKRVFHCPKRGYGAYCDLSVMGEQKTDAAVYFAHPYPEAQEITGRLCFLYGIEIIE